MDDNKVVGAIKRVAGRAESTAGALVGDSATEVSGKAHEASGTVQQRYGETADAVRDFTARSPLTSLLSAAGIGLAIGLLINRR